jgi:hypothetical protein
VKDYQHKKLLKKPLVFVEIKPKSCMMLLALAANVFGLGDVAVSKCSIELLMFKIYTKCQKKY